MICCNRAGSPVTGAGERVVHLEDPDAAGVGGGHDGRQRRVDDVGEAHLLDVEPEGPRNDPGDVEQVLDELRLNLGVPVDRVQPLLDVVLVELARSEESGPSDDGVEGSSQLVREGRQELILHPAGRLGFGARILRGLIQGGVLHGQPGTTGQLLGDTTVCLDVTSAGLGRQAERQGPEDLFAGAQGYGHAGFDLKAAHELEVFGTDRHGPQPVVGHGRDELGPARFQHPDHRDVLSVNEGERNGRSDRERR